MESAIKELISEFNELWSNCNITFNTSNDIDAFIMRAYEIGKMVEKNNKKEATK